METYEVNVNNLAAGMNIDGKREKKWAVKGAKDRKNGNTSF